MAKIQIDGVGKVEVDNSFLAMAPAQQAAAVEEIAASVNPPEAAQPSTMVDIGRGALRGPQLGVSALLGAPGDLLQASDVAGEQLRAQTPETFEALGEGSLVGGFDQPSIGKGRFPTSEDIQGSIESLIGRVEPPQGLPGRLVERGLEFGTSAALAPFSGGITPLRLGIAGAAGGVGSEGLGSAFKGTKFEGLARLVGAIGGGVGGATAVSSIPRTGRALVREAVEGIGPDEFEVARSLQARGQAEGVPLLGPEAIESAPLQRLASDVASTPRGGAILEEATRARPQQVGAAVANQLETVSPQVTPLQAGEAAQSAAQSVVNQATQSRTAATSPLFQSAKDIEIPSDDIINILNRIDNTRVSRAGPLATELAALRKRLVRPVPGLKDTVEPETNAGVIESITKEFRDRSQLPKANPNAMSKETTARIGPILKTLNTSLEKNAVPIAEGRRLFQKISEEVVDPLQASITGRIADTKTIEQALRKGIKAVSDPNSVRPKDIRQTFRLLGRADPQAPGNLLRVHLENKFSIAARDLQSGPARQSGAKFRKAVFGGPQERANLRTMLDEIDTLQGVRSGTRRQAFENMMNVMERTARIPGIGSPTASRAEFLRRSGRGGALSGAAGAANVTKGSFIGQIQDFARNMNQRRNAEALARLFTAPDSVDQIELISRGLRGDEGLRTLAGTLSGLRTIQNP